MLELTEWIREARLPPKPWLIVGKGPTFSHRERFDLTRYNLMSLNHVVREMKVDVAHIIDVDVIEACADALLTNCEWLLVPRRPHRRFAARSRKLEDYFDSVPVLRRLSKEGRLVWYNSMTGPVGGSPLIRVRYFSSEAAVSILAVMGVKEIRTLGVDGGTDYSTNFEDLNVKTKLANLHPSFDLQFPEIEETVKEHGLDFGPLVEPMRVFVGCDDSQIVAARVLEYSIKKHASLPVQFRPMIDLPIPIPKDEKNRPRTGFSFYRFMIPELAGYRGRALYLDADMQVFDDLAQLWNIPFDSQTVLCTYQEGVPDAWEDNPWFHAGRQMSVMMLDCSRLDWDVREIVRGLDEGGYSYEDLMFELSIVPPHEIADRIPPEWNSLERFEESKTKLIHYTVVPTQPWKNAENPLRDLWIRDYRGALQAGGLVAQTVQRSIREGHVDPSLAEYLSLAVKSREDKVGVPTRIARLWWRKSNEVSRRVKAKLGRL